MLLCLVPYILMLCILRTSCFSKSDGSDAVSIMSSLQHNLTLLQNRFNALEVEGIAQQREMFTMGNDLNSLRKTAMAQIKTINQLDTALNSTKRTVEELEQRVAILNQTSTKQQMMMSTLLADLNRTKDIQHQYKYQIGALNQTNLENQKTMSAIRSDVNITKQSQHQLQYNVTTLYQRMANQQKTILTLGTQLNVTKGNQEKLDSKVTLFNDTNIRQNHLISTLEKDVLSFNNTVEQKLSMLGQLFNLTSEDLRQQLLTLGRYVNNSFNSFDVNIHDIVSVADNITRHVMTLQRQVHSESLAVAENSILLDAMNSSIVAKFKPVAFTVSTLKGMRPHDDEKIIYDKVITNIGNVYSKQTGVFTCTSDGEYLFTWNAISTSATQYCQISLYRNGESLLGVKIYQYGGSSMEAASNSITLSLVVGDKVWTQGKDCRYFSGYPYTAFTGIKL